MSKLFDKLKEAEESRESDAAEGTEELRLRIEAERAAQAARLRAAGQEDLKLVSDEREKAEARLQSLSARRKPVLLAVSGAVLLSLLLGLYVGWREPEPAAVPQAGGEPVRLKLETSLGTYKP